MPGDICRSIKTRILGRGSGYVIIRGKTVCTKGSGKMIRGMVTAVKYGKILNATRGNGAQICDRGQVKSRTKMVIFWKTLFSMDFLKLRMTVKIKSLLLNKKKSKKLMAIRASDIFKYFL